MSLLVLAYAGSPGQRAVKWLCVCVLLKLLCVVGVMDVAIVERGRNVVSASRDGTARLWDCGQSACLAKYAADSVINGCSVHTPSTSVDLLQPDHASGIVFTAASYIVIII